MATLNKEEMLALANNPAPDQTFANSPAKIEDLGVVGGTPGQQRGEIDLGKVGGNQSQFMNTLAGKNDQPVNMRAPGVADLSAQNASAAPGPAGMPASAQQSADSAPAGLPDGNQIPMQAGGGISGSFGADKDSAMGAVNQFDAQSRGLLGQQQAGEQDAYESSLAAEQAKAAYEDHKAASTAKVDAAITVEATRYQNKMDQINKDSDLAMKNEISRIQGAVQAAQDFQFKDFWSSRSTMGSIMGIMAAALGGAANGIAGQPGAQTPLDRVMAQDLEQQKLKYGQLKDNVSNERSLFQDLVQQTGSVRSAEAAFHDAAMAKFDAVMKQTVSGMGQENANAQYLIAAAALKQKRSDNMGKYTTQRLDALKTEAGLKVQIQLTQQQLAAKLLAKMGAGQIDQLAGQGVIGGDFQKGEAVKLNQTMSQGKRALDLISQLRNNPSLLQDQGRRAELQSAVANIMNQGRTSKVAQDSIDVGMKGGVFTEALNRMSPATPHKLDELEMQVKKMLGDQISGKGGIIAPILPNGQKNPFFNKVVNGPVWDKYVQSRGANRVAPTFKGGDATQEAAASDDVGGSEQE